MGCGACGRENRAGARFCVGCGTALAAHCPACQAELPTDARFCDHCGTAVEAADLAPAAPPATQARKVVTVVFADLSGSTGLHETLDPESVRRVMNDFYAALRTAVDDHGGTIVKFTGDGIMAAFGVDVVSEDDAWRAVLAASAMQERFAGLRWDASLSLRVGVNTGEVIVTEGDVDVVGDAVNVAARLEGAAGDGEILVGENTWRLTRQSARFEAVAPLTLRGRAEPVLAFKLVSVGDEVAEAGGPFVGRDAELASLLALYEDAVSSRAARLATVVGSPGLGKSRLAVELVSALGSRATVLEARFSASAASTFGPVIDALRAVDGDAELGDLTSGSPQAMFLAFRRSVEALASERPVVFVLEDLHWAEPLLLDLVEHLVEWTQDAPVLLLALARPELRQMRPALVETAGRASLVSVLEGLDPQHSEQLACDLLDTERLPPALVGRILESSEGNPLFVRELVRMLVDDGVLQRRGVEWRPTIEIDAISVPPTIQSLLAARVERLQPDERAVLECAAVVGREFYRGAVAELLPQSARGDLGAVLERLRQKEMVEPAGTYWIDEPVLRFHHVLVRDAAYRRLLKEVRADLHERYARWLDARAAGSPDHDDVLGYHLEQAHRYRVDLGQFDDHTAMLGHQAATRLASAGRRALDGDDLPAAAGLLTRALAGLDGAHPDRPALLIDLCEALVTTGALADGALAISELEALAAGSPRLRAWASCFAAQHAILADPSHLTETVATVEKAAADLAKLSDSAGAAKAHAVHASALARLGRVAECEAALDRALAAARDAGDTRRATAVLAGAPLAALWGPSPVARASGRCLDVVRVLRITTSATTVEATSLRCQAVLEALRGRSDAARRMLASARKALEELGHRHGILSNESFAGLVELLADDPARAEALLRGARDGFVELGAGADAGQAAALLARAVLAQGRADEAEVLTEESERLGGADLKTAIAWRAVRAEALARRDAVDAALDLARAAVALAEPTDGLLDQADTHLALATVLQLAGRTDEVGPAATRAADLYDRKGATVLAERARALAGSSAEPRPAAAPATPTSRRISPNAVTRAWERALAVFDPADIDPYLALFTPDAGLRDHTHPQVATYSMATGWATMKVPANARIRIEPLATLGRRHALGRMHWPLMSSDSGVGEVEDLRVQRVNEQGLIDWTERFAAQDLHLAVGRLLELNAEDEAPETIATASTAAAWIRLLNPNEAFLDGGSMYAEDTVLIDHREIASLGTILGRAAVIEANAAFSELVGGNVAIRLVELLALDADARAGVVQGVLQGGPPGAGFEMDAVMVTTWGSDGLLNRAEWFGADQVDQALARFDELVGVSAGRAAEAPTNAAARANMRFLELLLARDWETIRRETAPAIHQESRRRSGSFDLDGIDAHVHNLEVVADTGATGARPTAIATRGEHLVLARVLWTIADTDGRVVADLELLMVDEYDDVGRKTFTATFDPEDLDVAFEILDARYRAGEGSRYAKALDVLDAYVASFAERDVERDVERLCSILSADYVVVDHRPSTQRSATRDEYVGLVSALLELAPEFRPRVLSIPRICERGLLWMAEGIGTDAYGSTFEITNWQLFVVAGGQIVRHEAFPLEAFSDAEARFDELTGPAAGLLPPSPAVAVAARGIEAWKARDWAAVAACFAPDATWEDRRTFVAVQVSGLETIVSELRRPDAVNEGEAVLVATRGRHLVLGRSVTWGHGDDGQVFEVEILQLMETDSSDRISSVVTFDADDFDGAFAELDARYMAGEAAPHRDVFAAAVAGYGFYNRRDWPGALASLTEDAVMVDRRPQGWGQITREEFIQRHRGLAELVPDVTARILNVLRLTAEGFVGQVLTHGTTPEGGVVEYPFFAISLIKDGRIITRLEFLPIDDPHDAIRRFDQLTSSSISGSGLAIANACTQVVEREIAAHERGDFEAAKALFADEALIDDRRPIVGVLVSGEQWSAQARAMASVKRRVRMPIAVRGERLALFASTYLSHRQDAGESEVKTLEVFELDAAGRIASTVVFDADELNAALAYLDERFCAGEGAASVGMWRLANAFLAGYAARDWDAVAAWLADDLEVIDHRQLGWPSRNREDYLATVRALADQATSDRLMRTAVLRWAEHCGVALFSYTGVGVDGGAFERQFVMLTVIRNDQAWRLEYWDVEDLDNAIARFDELTRAKPPTPIALSNRCSEVVARYHEARNAKDWERYSSLLSDDSMIEDRRPLIQISIRGRAERVLNAKTVASYAAADTEYRVLATRGERLAIVEATFHPSGGGGPAEVRIVEVFEIDSEARIAATVIFEPDDLDAAFAELDERYVVGEGRGWADAWRAGIAFMRAYSTRDWAAAGALLADDLEVVDHRRLGWAVRSRDDYLATCRALADQLAEDHMLVTAVLQANERGDVSLFVQRGTDNAGVAFERPFAALTLWDNGQLHRCEYWEVEDLHEAIARFEELTTEETPSDDQPSGALEAAVWASAERLTERWLAHDWDGLAALFTPDAVWEDRRPGMRTLLRGQQEVVQGFKATGAVEEQDVSLIATRGDSLCLSRGVWTGHDRDGVRFEVEALLVLEVATSGLLTAIVQFAPDDLDAAFAELEERYYAGEGSGSAAMWPVLRALLGAYAARDWDAAKACLAEDLEVVDNRLLGWPRGNRDDYLVMMRATAEQASEDRMMATAVLRAAEHADVSVFSQVGVSVDGVAFERQFVLLTVVRNGQASRLEYWNIEDVDQAIARFDELTAGRTHRMENEASDVAARIPHTVLWAGDDAFAAMFAADAFFEDRRPLSLTSARGGDQIVARTRGMIGATRGEQTLIATRGDRLALVRISWYGTDDNGSDWELPVLQVYEIDSVGLITTVVQFEADNLDAAYDELDARYSARRRRALGVAPHSLQPGHQPGRRRPPLH